MRRMTWLAGALALAVSVPVACSTSGANDGADDLASTSEAAAATGGQGRTTTTASTSGSAGIEAVAAWSEVVEVARARHGTVERMANVEDPDSGELVAPEMPITIEFDGDRKLIHATIEVPASEDSTGGTIEYVIGPDVAVMSTDWTLEKCGADWVDMSALGSTLGSGLGELGSLGTFPMPPFDLIAEHAPVDGTVVGGEASFDLEIPASLLVSEAQQRQYEDLADQIEGVDAPAEVLLGADGSLEVAARAPLLDILPLEPSEVPPEAQGLDMTGWWRLEPSDEPLGLTVPTADAAADDCLDD